MIIPLLVLYIAAVLYITLLSREAEDAAVMMADPLRVYKTVILSVIEGAKPGWDKAFAGLWQSRGLLAGPWLNVLLFVPMGILVPCAFPRIDRWWKVLLAGLASSLAIEMTQYITHLGWFDAADLLHNAAGALIGWVIWQNLIRKFFSYKEKR